MIIPFKEYEIEIKDDNTYSIKSSNNSTNYRFEYFGGQIIKNRVYPLNKRGIIVRNKKDQSEIYSAILCENGGRSKLGDGIYQIADEKIWTCIGDKIYCLNLPNLNITWYGHEKFGTIYSIHKFNNDFLIYGELGLIRMAKNGELKWHFTGKGIFLSGRDKIKILANQIELKDGNHQKYLIDEMGKEINQ